MIIENVDENVDINPGIDKFKIIDIIIGYSRIMDISIDGIIPATVVTPL